MDHMPSVIMERQLLSQSTERVSVTHKNLQQPIFGNSTMRMDASHRLTSPRRRRHPRRSHRRLKLPRRPPRLGSRYTTTSVTTRTIQTSTVITSTLEQRLDSMK